MCSGNGGYAHLLCPHATFDGDGFVAGVIYLPGNIASTLARENHEFFCLSRRRGHRSVTYFHHVYGSNEITSYPAPADDFENVPKGVRIYPGQVPLERSSDCFDSLRYNKFTPWPLYNVMVIERKAAVAHRLGVGTMHVHPFMLAKPEEKLVILG